MNKILLFTLAVIYCTTLVHSQNLSDGILFSDTRYVNEVPHFYKRSIRADFKARASIGVPGAGTFSGNITISPWADYTGGLNYQLNFNEGGIYFRKGTSQESSWRSWSKILLLEDNSIRIGEIGDAGNITVPFGAVTKQYNIDFTGYRDVMYNQVGARIAAIRYNRSGTNNALIQNTALVFYTNSVGLNSGDTDLLERMRVTPGGFVGIGTDNPDQLLTVKGKIHAQEVIVDLQGPLADYVFKPDYKLMPLLEIEQYVKQNGHLPEIPSAEQVSQEGLTIGEMQNKLLQKIEELTLHLIEQNKQISELKEENNEIKNKLSKFENK